MSVFLLQQNECQVYAFRTFEVRSLSGMRLVPLVLTSLLLVGSFHPSLAEGHKRHRTSLSRVTTKAHATTRSKAILQRQRSIDDRRATQIQQALIKAGYLTGEPSGHWDSASQAAMEKLQADNGWQTKLVPDSRALIKLGLGPGNSPATDAASTTPASLAGAGSGSRMVADSN